MHQIHIFERERPAKQLVLECGDSLMLGRSRDCDIHFNQPDVSRYHARVDHRFNGLVWVIESRSGATLNGKTVFDEIRLSHGDTLELGGAVKIEVARCKTEAGMPPRALGAADSEVNDTMTLIHPVQVPGQAFTVDRTEPADLPTDASRLLLMAEDLRAEESMASESNGASRMNGHANGDIEANGHANGHAGSNGHAKANGHAGANGHLPPAILVPQITNGVPRLELPMGGNPLPVVANGWQALPIVNHPPTSANHLGLPGEVTQTVEVEQQPAVGGMEIFEPSSSATLPSEDGSEAVSCCTTDIIPGDNVITLDKASATDRTKELPSNEEEAEEETGMFEAGEDDPEMTGFWEPPTDTLIFEPIPEGETGADFVEEDMGQTIMMNPMDLEDEERKVIIQAERKKTMRTMGKLALCFAPVILLIAFVSRDTIILDQHVDWPKAKGKHLVQFEEVQPGLEIIYPKLNNVNLDKSRDGLSINSVLPSGVELFHSYKKEAHKRFLTMTDDEAFRWWAENAEQLYGVRPDMKLVNERFLTKMDGGGGVPYRHFPHTADGGRVGWTMFFRYADQVHTLRLEVEERNAYRAEDLLKEYKCIQINESFERRHWVPAGGDFSGDPYSVLGDIHRDLRYSGTGRWPQIQKDLIGILVQAAVSGDSVVLKKANAMLMSLRDAQAGWYLNARHQMRKGEDREIWIGEIQRLFGDGRDNRGIKLH